MATRTNRQAAPTRRLFEATQSFSTALNGTPTVIVKGQVVDERDPVLKGRAHLFKAFEPDVRAYPGQRRVEQATAAPGEVRE